MTDAEPAPADTGEAEPPASTEPIPEGTTKVGLDINIYPFHHYNMVIGIILGIVLILASIFQCLKTRSTRMEGQEDEPREHEESGIVDDTVLE